MGCRRPLTVARLAGDVDALDAAVRPMAELWSGAAAGRFDRHYAQWQHASRDLAATLTELAALVDTAHANYTGAATANAQIWGGGAPTSSGPAVVRAMSAGRAPTAIHAETDDVRATVTAMVGVADALSGAWQQLAAALAGTRSMAGDDPAGVGFGSDVDATVAVAWQGWRSGAILLGAVADGLAASPARPRPSSHPPR